VTATLVFGSRRTRADPGRGPLAVGALRLTERTGMGFHDHHDGKEPGRGRRETVIEACVHINLGPCGDGDVIENIEAALAYAAKAAKPPSREPAFTARRDTVLRLLVRGSDSGHVTVCVEACLACSDSAMQ
jgi:hypothetical protein